MTVSCTDEAGEMVSHPNCGAVSLAHTFWFNIHCLVQIQHSFQPFFKLKAARNPTGTQHGSSPTKLESLASRVSIDAKHFLIVDRKMCGCNQRQQQAKQK